MSVKIKDELIALNLLCLFLLLCILFLPDNPLRIIFGTSFVMFLPGYSLIAALYPRKNSINGTERILWSIGLSIAIVPLTGLCLNLIPPGISFIPVVISITLFIFIMSVVAWYRRRNLLEYERFSLTFTLKSPVKWCGKRILDRILFISLVMAILWAVGVIGYKITNPVPEERFTEFYILNADGDTFDYPAQLKIGEEGKVIIGLTNAEDGEMTYRVEMKVNGLLYTTIGGIALEHGETRQTDISFSFTCVGDNQKVEFALYHEDETKPLVTPLHLWIDISE